MYHMFWTLCRLIFCFVPRTFLPNHYIVQFALVRLGANGLWSFKKCHKKKKNPHCCYYTAVWSLNYGAYQPIRNSLKLHSCGKEIIIDNLTQSSHNWATINGNNTVFDLTGAESKFPAITALFDFEPDKVFGFKWCYFRLWFLCIGFLACVYFLQ